MTNECRFFGEVNIFGIAPKTLYEVRELIEETKKDREDAWDRIKMMICCNDPRTIVLSEDEKDVSPMERIKEIIDNCKEIIELNDDRLMKLRILEENWDKCHQEGLAIPVPPSLEDKFFYDGDWVETIEQPSRKQIFEEMSQDTMDIFFNTYKPKNLSDIRTHLSRDLYPREENYFRLKIDANGKGEMEDK